MKISARFSGALLLAFACATLLNGCGGEKKAEPAKEIKVGTPFELTGNVANYGKSALTGVELAVDEINKEGGINGIKVTLVQGDNKSEPSESANIVTKLLTQDKVVAVIGPATSGSVAACTPITSANKIPFIAPCATAPHVTVENGKVKEYVFRANFIDPFQGRVMAEFATKTLNLKNFAILFDSSSDYSKGLNDVFGKEIESRGGKILVREAFLGKDVDFKAQLTKIKASNPEAIFIPGYYEEISKIIKQARELNIRCPLLGVNGWESPKLLEIAGKEALKDCYYVSAFSVQDNDPSTQAFIKAYKAKYGLDPDIFAQGGYNAGKILFDAIKRAGDANDGPKVTKAIAETKNLQVAGGKITFDANHDPVIAALIISLDGGTTKLLQKISL